MGDTQLEIIFTETPPKTAVYYNGMGEPLPWEEEDE